MGLDALAGLHKKKMGKVLRRQNYALQILQFLIIAQTYPK